MQQTYQLHTTYATKNRKHELESTFTSDVLCVFTMENKSIQISVCGYRRELETIGIVRRDIIAQFHKFVNE